jgi:PKD repeat protein
VDFTDESSSSDGSINSWKWDFGNGQSSTNENPSVTYSSAGSYLVTLTVGDNAGNEASRQKTISVSDTPVGDIENNCWNDNDDDNDGLTDSDDPGCVEPNISDTVEGMIYGSHLTATMEGFTTNENQEQSYSITPSETEALYFSGFVQRGQEGSGSRWDDSGSGSITHHYVDAARPENDKYGLGFHQQESFSSGDFVSGAALTNGRVIDPPHDFGGQVMCGNGMEDESISKTGQDAGESTATTPCRADWGRIQEKYDAGGSQGRESPYNHKGDTGMKCEDDEVTCSGRSCEICGGSCGQGSCTFDDDNSDDTGNQFWETTSEEIYTESCTVDSTDTIDSLSGCSKSTGCCSSYSCDRYGNSCCSSGDSCNFGSISEGNERSWEETNVAGSNPSRRNCNDYNTVDGGGLNSADDRSNNKADNDAAGTFTDFTSYSEDNGVGSGTVWCGYDTTLTVDVDGPQGNGDGFIVIDERQGGGAANVVARESPDGSASVGRNVHYGNDGSATNVDSTDYIGSAQAGLDLTCNGADTKVCIKYVDFYTEEGSPMSSSPDWTSVSEAVKAQEIFEASAGESYSVCKTINRINEENGDSRGENLIDCDYMQSGNDISPLPEACGDETREHLIMMEGPEVSQGTVEDYLYHEQGCVSWKSGETGYYDRQLDNNACMLKGKPVSEGTVANVVSGIHEPRTVEGYERPEDSPDYEVCLNIRGDSGISTSYDDKEYNYRYDDTSQSESNVYGGQWYDLDDPRVNEYLRDNEGSLSLSTTQRSGDPDYVDYYYTRHPNPEHSDYNPEGDKKGTSLLADCGPLLPSCSEDPNQRQSINADDGTVFAFFEEFNNGKRTRDEDLNPIGRNFATTVEANFDPVGTINFIKSRSDQLSPGNFDYDDTYSPVPWYRSTQATEDEAVQYAYTRYMNWSVASTGVPYPHFGAADTGPYVDDNLGNYYREDYTGLERNSPDDSTVQKTSKAFGNSIAVVAQQTGITDNKGDSIAVGEGYWIDPDDIKNEYQDGNIQGMQGIGGWRDLLKFKIDLTGPDSGIGYDLEEGSMSSSDRGYVDELRAGGDVVFADIYWEGLNNGGIEEEFETPVCGDDRYEFLLEEMGESANSERFEGRYACATTPDQCVSYESGSQILYDSGGGGSGFEYTNTNEKREDVGRLKQDEEACAQRPVDTFPMWYDQDYGRVNGELTCRENSLYEELGVRWLPYDYINQHPHAVTGGIDDSWSERYVQLNHPSLNSDNDGFPDDPLDNGVSPVDTGTNFSRVADPTSMDYGFCAGDDASEYLVYQKSETRFVDTDNSVLGAAASPRSCVLENSRLDNSDEERRLYEEGDRVQFTVGDGSNQEIACYDGAWWGSWPVVFLEDEVSASLGETRYASFRVINPEETSRTFDLTLSFSDPQLDQISTFASSGANTMNTTIPGGESRTFDVEIVANRELTSEQIDLTAETRRGDLQGSDNLEVSITPGSNVGSSSGQTRDVPGLTFIQLVVAGLIASVVVFFRN